MENEVARCIAEGMAEKTLDALEKKVKELMGDTPVPEKIAGLGDPIVIEIPNKEQQYAELKGRRFRPTFSSLIDYFEIIGYDAERDMVLTTAHPKDGSPFDDEIEERYLVGAFETGEYKAVNDMPVDERTFDIMARPYRYMMPPVVTRKQKFNGPCCDRCQHRFGTTSNHEWCQQHYQNNRCYRFKLETK